MARMNMDIEQDLQGTEEQKQQRKGGKKSIFYAALPNGRTQGLAYNKVYFGVFSPASWPLFQERPGVTLANSIPSDLGSYYWRLHVHYRKVRMPDGNYRDMPVLCPAKQNAYHVDILKRNPLFIDSKCRLCEEAAARWSQFDAEWQRATNHGQPLGDRWSIQRDQFNQIVGGNPVLHALHEEANQWACQARYVFMVLDLSKLFGERKLEPDETTIQFEPFLGPKAIFDGLLTLINSGIRFYDDASPQVICLTKDTTKGARFAKYAVSNLGPWPIDPGYRAYIASDANMPVLVGGRPGEEDAQFLVLSYQEQRELLDMMGEPGTCQANPSTNRFAPPGAPPGAPIGAPAPYGMPQQPIAPYAPPVVAPYGAPPSVAMPQPTFAAPGVPLAPTFAAPPAFAPSAVMPQPSSPLAPSFVAPQAPMPQAPMPQAPMPQAPAPMPQAPMPQAEAVAAPAPAPMPAPEAGSPKPRRGRANW